MSDYVSIRQAADHCGVKPGTVSKWLSQNKITKHTAPNGYHVRINLGELEAFDESRRSAPSIPESGV